jgi:rhodanese-related sulfurtransferase
MSDRITSERKPFGAASIDELLDAARARLVRLSPEEAYDAAGHGALLVDIRPVGQRASEGEIPGALVIDRNVLEWRLDPASSARLPEANRYDGQVVILCAEGYASSLAAAALHELGLSRTTDVIGGYRAWQAAGLPTAKYVPVARSSRRRAPANRSHVEKRARRYHAEEVNKS